MSETTPENLADMMGPSPSEKSGMKSKELDISYALQQAEDEESAKGDAQEIWEDGRALEYMVSASGEQHTGDTNLRTTLFLSYAATRVLNSSGIHVSISGPAGTGKSHSAKTVAEYLPPESVVSARLSNKALWYHKFPAGTVFLLDDQELTEDMQELVKVATTNWEKPSEYKTVVNQKDQTLVIEPRCPFWVAKVELNGDEQILDRQIMFWTDDTIEQRQAIRDVVYESVMSADALPGWNYKAIVSQKIWKLIPSRNVLIPYAKRIECDEWMDIRITKLLLSLLQSSALMHAPHRVFDKATNSIIAEESDFYLAANIINPLLGNKGGSQKLKLSTEGAKVLDFLKDQPSGQISYYNLRNILQLSDVQLSRALNGRSDTGMDGLVAVCPAIEPTYQIVHEDRTGTSHRQKCITWDYDAYRKWCSAGGHFTLRDEE